MGVHRRVRIVYGCRFEKTVGWSGLYNLKNETLSGVLS